MTPVKNYENVSFSSCLLFITVYVNQCVHTPRVYVYVSGVVDWTGGRTLRSDVDFRVNVLLLQDHYH